MLLRANVLEGFLRGDDGRNVVRYVPASKMQASQEAIEGYQLFITLAQQYTNEVIRLTRHETQKKKNRGKTKT